MMQKLALLTTIGAAAAAVSACGDAAGRRASGADGPPPAAWPKLAGATGAGLRTLAFPRQQTLTAPGAALTDVISHLPPAFGSTYVDADKVRWAHETSHGIHRHLAAAENRTGRPAQGFYLMNDRAAVAAEPKLARADVAPFVPEAVRGPRYQLFLGGGLGDQPLTLVDELTALCNGSLVAVEAPELATAKAELEALVETLGYALSLGRAVQAQDVEYFTTYPQFAELLAHESQRALTILRATPAGLRTPLLLQRFDALRASAWELAAFGARLLGDTWAPLLTLPLPSDPGAAAAPPPTAVVPRGAVPAADADADGVPDAQDRCRETPKGTKPWTYGEWIGCAEGQATDD